MGYDTIVSGMKQEQAIVTGGAGFIGSHLCDELVHMGYFVTCIDNLSSGKKENIRHLIKNASFRFIQADVTNSIPEIESVNYIFHLASPASVIDYQNAPEETALANSVGTIHLLQLAKALKARFLFASTSEIYGDPKEHPQKETYWGNVNPVGIRSCYDESKRFGEMMTMLYFRKYNLDTRIVRIFNTFGPRMRPTDGRVISNFINQAIRGDSMTIYGSGKQTRSFCYISDLIDGIVKVMFSSVSGEIYNLGNPAEHTIVELAQKITRLTQSSSKIVYKDLPLDDPEKRKPDITKAKTQLGWEPIVRLDDGLDKTITYYKNII